MKVIIIDPFTKTVSEREVEKLDLSTYYQLIGCDLVEAVHLPTLKDKHFLYVDEEGLLTPNQSFFNIEGFYQSLAGRAIVLKDSNGKDKSCTLDVGDIYPMIAWLGQLNIEL